MNEVRYVFPDQIGSVQLVQVCGSDAIIAAAARVSYANDIITDPCHQTEEQIAADAKLIKYMLDHDHGSPFEHNLITWRIKAPLFVVAQIERHRIGVSFNEESGRYAEAKPEFYVPQTFRRQDTKNKQGSVGEIEYPLAAQIVYRNALEVAYGNYLMLIQAGVAREQARAVLPQALYKSLWVTMNVRSLMHFLTLRLDTHAQWETRKYAKAFFHDFETHFEMTAAAFLLRLGEKGMLIDG